MAKRKKRLRKTVDQLNIIDDALFQKMAEDIGFCEEVISTILEKEIRLLKVTEQQNIKNLQGRSVILDALCMDETGKQYNIEVQKSDNDDHQKRVRYNGACITTNFAEVGKKFLRIPDVIVIFISRFDLFQEGKTVYHIRRIIKETGTAVENGFEEVYVNAAVNDGSKIARLMDIFTDISKYDFEMFPKTSARKKQFKEKRKGDTVVCDLVEQYAKECVEENDAENTVQYVENCAESLGFTIEKACAVLHLTLSDYEKAKKKLKELAEEENEEE